MRVGKTQIGKWKTQPRGALNQCLSKQAPSVSLSQTPSFSPVVQLHCLVLLTLTLFLTDTLLFSFDCFTYTLSTN